MWTLPASTNDPDEMMTMARRERDACAAASMVPRLAIPFVSHSDSLRKQSPHEKKEITVYFALQIKTVSSPRMPGRQARLAADLQKNE
jgi:hypothetical protein